MEKTHTENNEAAFDKKSKKVKDAWMDTYFVELKKQSGDKGEHTIMRVTVRNFLAKFNTLSSDLKRVNELLTIVNSIAQVTVFELRRVDKENDFFKQCDPKLVAFADEAIKKAKSKK